MIQAKLSMEWVGLARVLVEAIPGISPGADGVDAARRILAALPDPLDVDLIVHGEQDWAWPVLRWARQTNRGIAGLEDMLTRPAGGQADSNAALLQAALSIGKGRRMILVTGATGNAGGAVVRALAEGGAPVRGLVRRPGSGLPPGAEEVVGDLNKPATFVDGLRGATGLFMLSGYDGTPELLSAASAAGVRHVVVLSSNSLDGKDTTNAISAYHAATEQAVRDSGLGWSFLRPTTFMSNALRWNNQLARGDVVRLQFPDVPIATIDPRDIADVAVAAFNSSENHIYRITGPVALTPVAQLAILAEALGRPLEPYAMTLEETKAALDAGMPAQYAEAIYSFFGNGTADETTVRPTVAEVTGHPGRTFEQWCADHASEFPGAA